MPRIAGYNYRALKWHPLMTTSCETFSDGGKPSAWGYTTSFYFLPSKMAYIRTDSCKCFQNHYVVGRGSSVGIARLATGWRGRGSNLGGDEIFRTRPDGLLGLPSLLYKGYWVSFPGVKRPGLGVNHPPPFRAEVKERVELHLYSHSGPSWPVVGRTLLCLFTITLC